MSKYVCTTDGWCQTWSDAPVGRSLLSFLTNETTTISGTMLAQSYMSSIWLINSYLTFCTIWVIKSYLSKVAGGAYPMSGGVTFVKYDCKDLPTGASDHLWHHPSIARAYFLITMYFKGSRVPRVTHPGRSLVTPGGYTLQYNEEICVHYWRMVSNMIRCTQWKVFTIILDKYDAYTQWYPPKATFDKFELITHRVQNGLRAMYHLV